VMCASESRRGLNALRDRGKPRRERCSARRANNPVHCHSEARRVGRRMCVHASTRVRRGQAPLGESDGCEAVTQILLCVATYDVAAPLRMTTRLCRSL
jgi:hypothetical protein